MKYLAIIKFFLSFFLFFYSIIVLLINNTFLLSLRVLFTIIEKTQFTIFCKISGFFLLFFFFSVYLYPDIYINSCIFLDMDDISSKERVTTKFCIVEKLLFESYCTSNLDQELKKARKNESFFTWFYFLLIPREKDFDDIIKILDKKEQSTCLYYRDLLLTCVKTFEEDDN